MKHLRYKITSRRPKGFTLVEMLIVGALIALFAGLAIIGIQAQFRVNQRKAVIGETRQVATALDFTYNDLGFFPKIGFLQDSITSMRIESQTQFGDPDIVFNSFAAYGIPTPRQRVSSKWNGPYFAASQSRSRVAQGRGGSRFMRFPTLTDSGGLVLSSTGWPWPVDTWNNPYMFYSMHIDPDTALLYFTTAREDDPTAPNLDPGKTGNAINAVVSYGPNQVPGGGELYRDPNPNSLTSPAINSPNGLRLYVGNPNATADPLRLLTGVELVGSDGLQRANAWSVEYWNRAGFGTGILALDDENEDELGITDAGSDDVVFTF